MTGKKGGRERKEEDIDVLYVIFGLVVHGERVGYTEFTCFSHTTKWS